MFLHTVSSKGCRSRSLMFVQTLYLLLGVVVFETLSASSASPEVCTYDYTLVQRVGQTTYDGLPLKILRQGGDGTVDFVVGNTWAVQSETDTLNALYVVTNFEQDGSKSCYGSSEIQARTSIDSSLAAQCSNAGVAIVKLYATDDASTFGNATDTATIPDECPTFNIFQTGAAPAVEYTAILQCTPTCQENHLPDVDPFSTDNAGPPRIIPLACPEVGADPIVAGEWRDGDFAQMSGTAGGGTLCTLVEMDVGLAEDGITTTFANLKPVGRSYSGNPWEASPGAFASYSWSGGSVALPKPPEGRAYVVKSYDYGHELTADDLTARFLEKATFGPTKTDIAAFSSPSAWMAEQFAMEPTSHRRFFRERTRDWFYYTTRQGNLFAGPCEEGSRYRNFALTRKDHQGYLHVAQSPFNSSKLVLSVGGEIRTIVDAPMAYGRFRKGEIGEELTEIDIDAEGTSFYINKMRPTDGVGGRFELTIETSGKTIDKDIFFNGVSGNPRVQFDEEHEALLGNITTLGNNRWAEVEALSYFEGTPEVLQITKSFNNDVCRELNEEVVGFTYPPKSIIVKTVKQGVTKYWMHSPTFRFLGNTLDEPLADGGKEGVDRTAVIPPDLLEDYKHADSLQTKCSNAARTFLNEDSCKLTDADACSYDSDADIDETAGGKVLVCGSPNEVASNTGLDSATREKGSFGLVVGFNSTEQGTAMREQRRNVWAEIALNSKDQLRQRMAYALSQILVITDETGSKDCSESFLSYYDIFVRNAFGNYFDILKEVTYHPMMGRMLTYVNGLSTGFAYIRDNYVQQADENYAREVMQLFSMGLALQNDDGTLKLDSNGNEIATYTNFDISEYAKVYVGLKDQYGRGNIECRLNEIDPLRIRAIEKDKFPKLGINSKFVGDGYPLCSDLPHQQFLKKGALYRILGAKANADFYPEHWRDGDAPKRLSLDFASSNLAKAFCNGDGDCDPPNFVALSGDIECHGIECEIQEPRTLEVAEGLWYEYIRPPCVNHAFYNNGRSVYKIASEDKNWKQLMCGNPLQRDASAVCCRYNRNNEAVNNGRKEFFGGERVIFDTVGERCSEAGLELCDAVPRNISGGCEDGDACDNLRSFYWLSSPCSMSAKVSPEGNIAVVHQPSAATGKWENLTYAYVSSDSKSFFRTEWKSSDVFPEIEDFLDDFDANCESIEGCFVDLADGNCQCEVVVEDTMAFENDSDLLSLDNVLSKATIGVVPESSSFGSTGVSGVKKSPSGALSINTVFEVTDNIGRTHYRKNVLSIAKLGDGSLKMRNPVTFWSLNDLTNRDGEYEMDAALEHYFFHPNVPSFLAKRLAQRFGSSNPSPRYVEVIANAFKTGSYGGFGSNKYGCLEATVAAIILDREAQDHILDADPIHGQLQGPYMRLIKAMRASEYTSDPENPIVRFKSDIMDKIGEEPHKLPTVFSFFGPTYTAPGRVRSASVHAPEAQVHNGPTSISLANGLFSLFKYGSSRCGDSFFGTTYQTKTEAFNVCVMGDDSTNFGNNKYDPANYGLDPVSSEEVVNDLATLLTSGRLSPENRQIIRDAFEETLINNVTDNPMREALINAQQLVAVSPEFHSNTVARRTNQQRELPPIKDPTGVPYKAVVHFMLAGGLDSFNVLVPNSCTGTNPQGTTVDIQYLEERGSLAFNRAKGEFDLTISPNSDQPCSSFAIHEDLPYIQKLYNDGDLLFFANTGVVNQGGMNRDNWDAKTKSRLFGHGAMQKEAKKVDPYDVLTGTGVLGRLDDLLISKFGSVVNAIGIAGNSIVNFGNPEIEVPTSIVGREGPIEFGKETKDELWFDIQSKTAAINSQHDPFSGVFGDTWSDILMNGIEQGDQMTIMMANETNVGLDAEIWKSAEDDDKVSKSFETLARVIQTRGDRNVDRDTFTIQYNGFDHHQHMKQSLKEKLIHVNRNLERFIEQLKKDEIWDQVTIVVASEFGRTISVNSNDGADHGWGGNYMVMGGSLNGGRILGKYPDDITSESRLNAARNTRCRLIPTLSWDHIYNAIVGWMTDGFEGKELTEEDLDYVLPNRRNVIDPVEGEGPVPLFNASDLFNMGE